MTGPMDTLSDRMRHLRANGWIEDFSVDEGGVCCDHCRRWAAPEDVIVDLVQRFEGPSDPADESILFAITMPGPHRGLLPAAYGPEVGSAVADVMQRLRLPPAEPPPGRSGGPLPSRTYPLNTRNSSETE